MLVKNKYKIKKNKNFFFGLENNIAKIYIKKTYSNIFVTLTDLNNKVIICKTSGSSDIYKNKRKKKISQAVEKIVYNINNFLKLYEIKYVEIILKMKIKSHIYILLEKLNYFGIIIMSICSLKILPHNGVKGRNERRL
jgi:ribosomal protein S11